VTSVRQSKQIIRERVWSQLETAGVVDQGVAGYIPDFRGSDRAAERLAELSVWQQALVLEVAPDRAQFPARALALEAGKLLYMAVPKLAEAKPFYLLDPQRLPVTPAQAADRTMAARIAPLVDVSEMQTIDLIVVGSVAVNSRGVRLGKGAGYSDIEFGLLAEAGLITEQTTVCTTVHELQVLDDELPEEGHDFRVDLIVTPERVIQCDAPRRPSGV
jgi:5-formyltetrahydrofolate cyclo-ligase